MRSCKYKKNDLSYIVAMHAMDHSVTDSIQLHDLYQSWKYFICLLKYNICFSIKATYCMLLENVLRVNVASHRQACYIIRQGTANIIMQQNSEW